MDGLPEITQLEESWSFPGPEQCSQPWLIPVHDLMVCCQTQAWDCSLENLRALPVPPWWDIEPWRL
jgi:hypothetical protein